MVTIDLGADGEYGRRLVRYLEIHMDNMVRLRHFTKPDQLFSENLTADLMILSRDFHPETSGRGSLVDLSGHNIIWITEEETEEGYCLFHPPQELLSMIRFRLEQGYAGEDVHNDFSGISALFSPVYEPEMILLAQSYMRENDLYLGMEDLESGSRALFQKEYGEGSDIYRGLDLAGGSMGDLCYYIHLRDKEILSRIKELSVQIQGCDILPASVQFFPLLELTQEDYIWFFEKLKSESAYAHIYVGIGCAMFGSGRILPHVDRLILISSREHTLQKHCCEYMLQSVRSGMDLFCGSCELIFREDVLFDAG